MIDPAIYEQSVAALLLGGLFGYLIGSVPFGLILTRFAGLGDIRNIGSRNIGATNVMRTGRRDLALMTFLLDAGKGTVAVLLASVWWDGHLAAAAGVGAFVGHILPVWIGFRGGKGVATYLGVSIGLFWPAGLAFAVVWLGMAYAFKYSSLAALSASVTVPIILVATGKPEWAGLMAAAALILWLRHAGNIRRLLAGTESRIGSRA
ncbi:MAG: glycerol-3-phosphate 1-O-acyltransferase PlsY [Alphaproteobacteria bacterium]